MAVECRGRSPWRAAAVSRSLRLSYRELAEWLDLPADAVRRKARRRADEGQWRIIPADGASGDDMVELPAADLNRELDARHDRPAPEGGRRGEPAEAVTAGPAPAHGREAELNRLLIEARDAMAATQERLRVAERERAELAEARAAADTLRDQLVEAKTALIAAYDRVLAMQQELAVARENATAARHEAAEAESILAILDRLRSKAR